MTSFTRGDFQRLLEENQTFIHDLLDAQRRQDFKAAVNLHNLLHRNITRLAAASDFNLVAQDNSYWPPGLPTSSYWPSIPAPTTTKDKSMSK
ncbi:hypothetical protein P9112_008564 [Eukaryota sp. TZLM1-RC]